MGFFKEFEKVFAAAAFAEHGEFDTAMEILEPRAQKNAKAQVRTQQQQKRARLRSHINQ